MIPTSRTAKRFRNYTATSPADLAGGPLKRTSFLDTSAISTCTILIRRSALHGWLSLSDSTAQTARPPALAGIADTDCE